MGYTKESLIGVSWNSALRIATRAVAFLKTIILARILVPSQFGAYGVALLVLGFLEVLTETGVNVILIQEQETEQYINSAWIVSIIRGLLISLLIIVLTPFIANFFHSPQSAVLLYFISIVPILRGFINPSIVKLQKNLHFGKEFWYRFIIFLTDTFFAITITYITKNPLGIVIGVIAGAVVEVVLSYIIVKPLPALKFDSKYVKVIIHRGKWVTASGIFNYLFHNADNVVVGRILGTGSLGLYQAAYSLSILPITEIADVFSRVTFPVYTKIGGDKARLKKAFLKTELVIAILTIPFGLILYFYPVEIISLVLGNRWLPAAPILPVLAIFGVIRAVSGSASTLFLALNKQEYVSVITFVSIAGLIIPIIPLVMRYGILGAAYSALIGTLTAVPVIIYYSIKVFNSKNEER